MAIIARYPMNGNANNTGLQGTSSVTQISGGISFGLKTDTTGDYDKASQSITTPPINDISLKSIQFRLGKQGSPTGVLTCKVYTGTGTGLVATSTTVNESSLTTSYSYYTFNFNGESVYPSTQYYFTLESTRVGDGVNYIYGEMSNSNVYSGGAYNRVNSAGIYNPTIYDAVFICDFYSPLNGIASNVTWVDGKEGQAASFSGVSTSYIIIPSAFYDLIKTRNDYWFDFWIYSGTTVNQIPLSYSAAADFYFYISSTGKIMLRRGTIFTEESGNSFEFNKWQKFTIQYTSATNANLYKNGKLVQAFSVNATPNITSNFYIGRYFDANYPFTGKVDRFQVGTGNLSIAEIKNDYLLTSGYYGQ